MATEAWRYNNMMARLRIARDKYYGGYGVGGDVGSGTIMTAAQINNAAEWCRQVTARSPLNTLTYGTVGAGALITVGVLDAIHNNINQVSNCHSNCHCDCNCTCNCDCNCTCTGRSSD